MLRLRISASCAAMVRQNARQSSPA
jgi:hypothetical protein